MNGTTARTVARSASGILTVNVTPGHPWDAVRALREGIRDLRASGAQPKLSFLFGIADDGSLTSLGAASLIVLGYAA
ncbi:MAG: hypothetical protein WD770_02890 [Actinomycetota bacterium]